MVAVGLCKSCYKAVCKDCAVESKNGLVCSECDEKLYKTDASISLLILRILLTIVFILSWWGLVFIPYFFGGKIAYSNIPTAILFSLLGIHFLKQFLVAFKQRGRAQ
jgi:cytochrome c biogenesis protein CcdA